MIAAAAGLGILEDKQFAVATFETEIERFWGPEDANLGLACVIGIAPLPVGAEADRSSAGPLGGGAARVERDFTGDPNRKNSVGRWRAVPFFLGHKCVRQKEKYRDRKNSHSDWRGMGWLSALSSRSTAANAYSRF